MPYSKLPRVHDVRVVGEPTTGEHIKACHEASDRARFVIIGIIIASILVFVALWNSFQWSWTHERLQLLKDTIRWYPYLLEREYGPEIDQLREGELPPGMLRPAEHTSAVNPDRLVGNILTDEQLPRFKRARAFVYSELGTLTPELGVAMRHYTILQVQLVEAQDLSTHKVSTVTVPFVGLEFDVNDLGPLGGLCFVVLLLWLRFSFQREYQNLNMTFKRAKQDDEAIKKTELARIEERTGSITPIDEQLADEKCTELDEVYHALAMRQVLTSPRFASVQREPFWDFVPYVLFSLPLIDQFAVLGYDVRTMHIGSLFNSGATIVVLILDFACLVLILMLTVECIRKYREINSLWNGQHRVLKVRQKKMEEQRTRDAHNTRKQRGEEESGEGGAGSILR